MLNWNIDGSSTTFAKNDNCVPQRLRDQPRKNENNLKEYWTQLTLRMRKTTRARFPIGFLIFSYPWFSHTYPHSNWICSSTRIRPYPDYFCYPWLLWEYWKLRMRRGSHLEYNIHGTTDLGISRFWASTWFWIHSVFKNFHSGERIQKVADSYAGFTGYVWTKAKTGKKK